MYKPDEDIDRLSRDAAEHYNAPGKPSWDALQQILDKELPQEKEKKRRGFFFFFWLLLGLSVAGTGLWYGVTINNQHPKTNSTDKAAIESGTKKLPVVEKSENANSNSSADKTAATNDAITTTANDVVKKTETTEAGSKVAAVISSTNKKANDNTASKNITAAEKKINSNSTGSKAIALVPATIEKSSSNVKGSKNKTDVAPVSSGQQLLVRDKKIKNTTSAIADDEIAAINEPLSTKTKLTQTKAGNQKASETSFGNNSTTKQKKHGGKKANVEIANPQDAATNEILTGIAANKNNNADTTTDNSEVITKSDDQQPVTSTPDTAANKAITGKSVVKTPAPVATEKKDSVKAVAKKKTTSKTNRAISIGLVAGIDESTVKFTHGANAGYNIGITGGYQFSKHWSVYTGAIYTKKNYNLNGADYHPPHPYWTLYVDLDNVEGYCKMWEIPLQARYTFNPGAKTPFFASAGLSSYFMTRQYYNYSWKNNMNQPMTGSWGIDSTFKHVFSILDLSVGFEKSLSKHINLQVEPYAKIPLGGVGFGNIRLSSFGINFSVQYRHPVKR